MKIVINLILLSSFFLSCRTLNPNFSADFSEEDLNIMAIITFMKHQKVCDTICTYKINNKLRLVDDLFLNDYYIPKKKYTVDKSKILNLSLGNTYSLECAGLGKLEFINEGYEYSFSPIVYNQDKKIIFGQAKKSNGLKYLFVIRRINTQFYIESIIEYDGSQPYM